MYITFNSQIIKYKHNHLQSFFSIKEDLSKLIKSKNFIMIYQNKVIEDNKTPYDYKMKQNDTIEIKINTKGGYTSFQILVIVFQVLIFVFIFLPFLFLGVFPFISFLVTNVFIKGLNLVFNAILSILDVNNWIYSLISTFKNVIVPWIKFIFEYSGIYFVTYLLTFSAVYFFYILKWGDLCTGVNVSQSLSGLTAMILTSFYLVFDLPQLLTSLLATLAPVSLTYFLYNWSLKMNTFRTTIFGYLGPFGRIQLHFVNFMNNIFKHASHIKDMDTQLLYNWNMAYILAHSPPFNQEIQDWGLEQVIEYVNFAQKQSEGQTTPILPIISRKEGAFAYFTRWLYDTGLYILLSITDLFDFCAEDELAILMMGNEIKYLEKITNQLEKVKRKNTTDMTNDDKKRITKTIEYLSIMVENLEKSLKMEKKSRLINVSCLTNIVENGTISGILTFIVFIICFIIFFFIVPNLS